MVLQALIIYAIVLLVYLFLTFMVYWALRLKAITQKGLQLWLVIGQIIAPFHLFHKLFK